MALTAELLRIQAQAQKALRLIRKCLWVAHLVLDGHFGHNAACQMVRQLDLHLVSKLRSDAALFAEPTALQRQADPRRKYGDRIALDALPVAWLRSCQTQDGYQTDIYQVRYLHTLIARKLNGVILRRYCENENEKGRIPAYLVHPIQVPFGPYVVTGKVDRIDFAEGDRYSIIDYKLDRRLPRGNAAETSDQLSFYALLVSEGLGMQIQDVRLYYLRHGIEQISILSKRRARETIEWIDRTANAIHKEKLWAPCAGAACTTCAFHSHCPAKTGQDRPHQSVWQQGNLLWDMNNEEEAASDGTEVAATAEPDRQMTLDDYL